MNRFRKDSRFSILSEGRLLSKRLVLVLEASSPLSSLLQLDLLPHRREDIPLDLQDVVVGGRRSEG
jgi:hypothetical protein